MNSTLQIILMTLSLHSPSQDNLNENNFGIGIETTTQSNITIGMYAFNNSYSETSIMLSAAKKLQLGNFYFAGGLAAATGYQKDTNSISGGVIISPEISLGYKYLRIKTSAPFGLITNNADVINFQIVFNLN